MPDTPKPVQLKRATLDVFDSYIAEAEEAMQPTLDGSLPFLWSETKAERGRQIRQGRIPAQLWSGDRPLKVPDGLIHDWIGAVFVPKTALAQTLACVQNYDNHKNIYAPDVMDSRLISHHDDDFKIYLRLLKKKIITVVLDTDHDVHYSHISEMECFCGSRTTRVAEVDEAGTAREKIYEPDTGYGFLWRLFSYWRFAEADKGAGTVIECRAVSLTRDIPFGLGWAIEPIIKTLPRESLVNTLRATRNAVK